MTVIHLTVVWYISKQLRGQRSVTLLQCDSITPSEAPIHQPIQGDLEKGAMISWSIPGSVSDLFPIIFLKLSQNCQNEFKLPLTFFIWALNALLNRAKNLCNFFGHPVDTHYWLLALTSPGRQYRDYELRHTLWHSHLSFLLVTILMFAKCLNKWINISPASYKTSVLLSAWPPWLCPVCQVKETLWRDWAKIAAVIN